MSARYKKISTIFVKFLFGKGRLGNFTPRILKLKSKKEKLFAHLWNSRNKVKFASPSFQVFPFLFQRKVTPKLFLVQKYVVFLISIYLFFGSIGRTSNFGF